MMNLTNDQELAKRKILNFLCSDKTEFVLNAPAGYGKTYLVSYILKNLKELLKPLKLITGSQVNFESIKVCATTNDAATVLEEESGFEVKTVYKTFGLSLYKNYQTGKLTLSTKKAIEYQNSLFIIEEASQLNGKLNTVIRELTHNCKIIYLGDHKQLRAIEHPCTVFSSNYPTATLTTNRRSKSKEINELSKYIQKCQDTGEYPALSYTDSKDIKYLNGNDLQEFLDTKYLKEKDIRLIAYSNDRVIEYNNYIRQVLNGKSDVSVGEYLATNATIMSNNTVFANVNNIINIVDILDKDTLNNIKGRYILISKNSKELKVFLPDSQRVYKRVINKLAKEKDWGTMFNLQETCVDLRPNYASTAHKAQGKSIDTVIVDLNDLAACRDKSLMLELLYVAVSRSISKVYLYGKL